LGMKKIGKKNTDRGFIGKCGGQKNLVVKNGGFSEL